MAASVPEGWVFTAAIPSYTQTTLQGDEVVVVGSFLTGPRAALLTVHAVQHDLQIQIASLGRKKSRPSTSTKHHALWRAQRGLQFYRVEVKVLPPEKTGQPRTRSVLRRFSHFLKLHGRVRDLASVPRASRGSDEAQGLCYQHQCCKGRQRTEC